MPDHTPAPAPVRLGLVYPGGGCEADFYRFEHATHEAVRVYLSNARFGTVGDSDHHPDALRLTANVEWICDAAARLRDVPLDALVWACTSASFIDGRAAAETQAARIEEITGLKTTSTSLAFAAAMHTLNVSRIAVLATYPQAATQAFSAFLSEYDVEVVATKSLGFESGWTSSTLDAATLERCAQDAMVPAAQALVIPDTALPTFDVIERLEQAIGQPVLSANAVSLWHGMCVAGEVVRVEGLGCLLDGPATPKSSS